MQPTKLEVAVLAWIADRNPRLREALERAVIHDREHTGAGCYVTLVAQDQEPWDRSPVDGPGITSSRLPFGGGSLLWTSDGRPACLELYSFGDVFPEALDDFVLES